MPGMVSAAVSASAKVAPAGGLRPHVLIHQGAEVVDSVQPHAGFDYPATLRGSTAHFKVYYDPALGANGPTIADAVLASCESEYNRLQGYFGGLTPPGLPFNIIVAPGVGGAYHYSCSATDLYCDGDTSPTPDVNHTRMLVVAEEVEVFSAAQGAGWNCGASNGERPLARFGDGNVSGRTGWLYLSPAMQSGSIRPAGPISSSIPAQ